MNAPHPGGPGEVAPRYEAAAELGGFIDASPTPQHAVANAAARLVDAGFEPYEDAPDGPGARFAVRDGALIAWVDSAGADDRRPLRMIGAHTDSPNLRIRPRPDTGAAGMAQLGVEVYGGALLNSWLDRDLGLAGQVAVRCDGAAGGVERRLFRTEEPILRVPQLAIHLDRQIGEQGLQLDRQQHMTPIWAIGEPRAGDFRDWLAARVESDPDDVLGWEVSCFDTQPAALIGRDGELLAAARLDNLCSSFGAVEALLAARWANTGPALIALFDHEEVGSTTATGAQSSWLMRVLERRSTALGRDRADMLAELDDATMLSADMAHATHPNYVERHEPSHRIRLGGGPVIKHNANARYATDPRGAAQFRLACEAADTEVQDYSHRGDLPCGSTIGPIAAAQLGVTTVDVGMAQLSMHSAREVMAARDVDSMGRAFSSWFVHEHHASSSNS